jgi:hypothetical protein
VLANPQLPLLCDRSSPLHYPRSRLQRDHDSSRIMARLWPSLSSATTITQEISRQSYGQTQHDLCLIRRTGTHIGMVPTSIPLGRTAGNAVRVWMGSTYMLNNCTMWASFPRKTYQSLSHSCAAMTQMHPRVRVERSVHGGPWHLHVLTKPTFLVKGHPLDIEDEANHLHC